MCICPEFCVSGIRCWLSCIQPHCTPREGSTYFTQNPVRLFFLARSGTAKEGKQNGQCRDQVVKLQRPGEALKKIKNTRAPQNQAARFSTADSNRAASAPPQPLRLGAPKLFMFKQIGNQFNMCCFQLVFCQDRLYL